MKNNIYEPEDEDEDPELIYPEPEEPLELDKFLDRKTIPNASSVSMTEDDNGDDDEEDKPDRVVDENNSRENFNSNNFSSTIKNQINFRSRDFELAFFTNNVAFPFLQKSFEKTWLNLTKTKNKKYRIQNPTTLKKINRKNIALKKRDYIS